GRPQRRAVGVMGGVGILVGGAAFVHGQGRRQAVELEPGVRQAPPGSDVYRTAAGPLHPVVDRPVAVIQQRIVLEDRVEAADLPAFLAGGADAPTRGVGAHAGEAADARTHGAVVDLLRVGVQVAGELRYEQVGPPVVGRDRGAGGRVDPLVMRVVHDREQVT